MKEPELTDPAAYPRKYASLKCVAEYLTIDRKTLLVLLDNGELEYSRIGKRRKIAIADLIAFEQRQRVAKRAS